jgi:hypothetical protein
MEKIYITLRQLIKMPGVFGVNKVEDLKFLFLGSWLFSPDKSSLCGEFEIKFNVFVNDFFRKEHKFRESFDWAKLIRLYSGSDKHSIELLGKIFDEYLESVDIDPSTL